VRTNHDKLIRDGIPTMLARKGVRFCVRRARPDEIDRLLIAKLREEVDELSEAGPPEAHLDELADVYEVLLAVAARRGLTPEMLERARANKARRRGGFTSKTVLEWTEDPAEASPEPDEG
jgi:predicted house-cleaning noncanonical NTP pyrophosphatase (MazG superfamily)